jgi:uncharacterized protein
MKIKGNLKSKIARFFRFLYIKLFRINDSPQRIALGFGLGVCLGIFPGTGPVAALTLAFVFKVNRASALLGALITNTWVSFITLLLAIKSGSGILGIEWQEVYNNWIYLLGNFSWRDLFKFSALKIILPVIAGYAVIGLLLGIMAYAVMLIIILRSKHKRNPKKIKRRGHGS